MKEMYDVFVYGAGEEYNKITPQLKKESSINVLGIITTKKQSFSMMDGFKCYCIDEIDLNIADYIIVAAGDWDGIYKNLIRVGGVKHEKILNSRIFRIPLFDFDRYIKVKESKPSIIANTCLAGMVYSELCLEFNSPTIASVCQGKEYIEFLNGLNEYMKFDIEKRIMTDNIADYTSPAGYPVGIINDEVSWYFVHSKDLDESIDAWNKRRKRVNFDNLFALMIISHEDDAYEFEKSDIKNKLGFFYKDLGLQSVIYVPGWENESIREHYDFYFRNYVQDLVTNTYGSNRPSAIDWLSFLALKKDFWRYEL